MYAEYLADEDSNEFTPYGVCLGFMDPSDYRLLMVSSAAGQSDAERSYSPAAEFSVVDRGLGKGELVIRIFNYGDAPSSMTYLWFVIWNIDSTTRVKRWRTPILVKARSSVVFTQAFDWLADFGLKGLSDLFNIYAVVCNPLEDPFETEIEEFLDRNMKNDQVHAINPCRYSIKTASYNLSSNPFTVSGNSITINCQQILGEYCLVSSDATDNALIQVFNPWMIAETANLLGQPRRQIIRPVTLRKTDLTRTPPVTFYTQLNGNRSSENSRFCIIETNTAGQAITFKWEDKGTIPPDVADDYVITFTFR
ncbi:MAG: hypothetical protein IPP99_11935 [Chitinophagaceae bacterium]|nr:hypothetical protein [Chitinophagaceae bacterium]